MKEIPEAIDNIDALVRVVFSIILKHFNLIGFVALLFVALVVFVSRIISNIGCCNLLKLI